jgi:hypothetical protein
LGLGEMESNLILIISVLIASSSAFLLLFLTTLAQRRLKEKQDELRKSFSNTYINRFAVNYDRLLDKYISPTELKTQSKATVDKYKQSYLNNLRNILVHYPISAMKTDTEDEVNSKIEEMNKRIEVIEERLPKKNTIDKLESVNDAVLATHIETLSESVKSLKEQILTKWDVAKVVFAIIGALGVAIAIVLGIINFVR